MRQSISSAIAGEVSGIQCIADVMLAKSELMQSALTIAASSLSSSLPTNVLAGIADCHTASLHCAGIILHLLSCDSDESSASLPLTSFSVPVLSADGSSLLQCELTATPTDLAIAVEALILSDGRNVIDATVHVISSHLVISTEV